MKNALLALALFAFVGSAVAHEGHNDKDKKGKKEACTAEAKAACAGAKATAGTTPACCAKKSVKTAAVTPAPAAPAAAPVKSL